MLEESTVWGRGTLSVGKEGPQENGAWAER